MNRATLITRGGYVALVLALAGCSSCLDRPDAPRARSPRPVVEEEVKEFPPGGRPQRPPRVRRAAVAGSWYFGDRKRLTAYLDKLLAQAPAPPQPVRGEVIALVSPHAGYTFSGKGAAAGFKLLRGRKIKRVVVLAVSHRVPFDGASIADVTHYETPLGQIPLDQHAVRQLRLSPVVRTIAAAHLKEHSLEMQLPLLQRVLPDGFKLVPLLLSRMREGDYKRLSEALARVVDAHTVVVASSDFTHRGANYGYELPAGEGPLKERLRKLDQGAINYLLKLDRKGLLGYQKFTGTTICGLAPVAQLLDLLGRFQGVKGQLVSHYTSGDVTGDWRSTVTYVDLAYTGSFPARSPLQQARTAGQARFPLSAADRATLLELARASVEAAVRRRRYDPAPLDALKLPPSLRRKAGAFVTLKCKLGRGGVCSGHGKDLRGCIGTIAPTSEVARTVARRAASAALDDPRFPRKVSVAELKQIKVEVSVLTPPRAVRDPREIVIGRHGIILRKGSRTATYLPQVAPEQGWNLDQTLTHLARKAGVRDWREASFQVYQAIVFSEQE